MARWRRGEAEVEQLVSSRELELVAGSQADGTALLAQARKTATTAAGTRGERYPQCLRAGLRRSSFSPATLS